MLSRYLKCPFCAYQETPQCAVTAAAELHVDDTLCGNMFCSSALMGMRRDVRQGLFLYRNPVPPNSNSSKILLQTQTSSRAHLHPLLVIISAGASARLCYVPCVNLETFLVGLNKKCFAAWLFQGLTNRMVAVAVPSSFLPSTADQAIISPSFPHSFIPQYILFLSKMRALI